MQKIFSIDFSNTTEIILSLNLVSSKDITILQTCDISVDKERFHSWLISENVDDEFEGILSSQMTKFIKKYNANNENAVVLIPPYCQISLNLELPFSNPPKHLDKIIKNEVQDMMPLSSDDLHVQYQFLKRTKTSAFASLPVHVSLISENIFRNILRLLKKIGVDPFAITTPAAVLGVINHLAKDFFKKDSAIIEKWGEYIHLLYIHNATQVHERSLPLVLNDELISLDNLVSQLRIALRAFENDTDSQIATVYYGENIDERIVKKIGKETEFLDVKQFLGVATNVTFENGEHEKLVSFSALASFLVQDTMPFTLSNFRMGKFDFKFQPQEVFKILKRLLPITVMFIVCIFLGIISLYYIRESRINNIYEGIKLATADKVSINGLEADSEISGEEFIQKLQSATMALNADLSQISSSYTVSPTKILEILSLDLSTIKGVEVSSFDFKGNRVKVMGMVPSYSDFEKLEKILQKRQEEFKSVKASQNAGKSKALNFTVEIGLND